MSKSRPDELSQGHLGFLPEDRIGNEEADAPWKRSETDKMLDLYFEGAHPKRIAQILHRNPKAIERRVEQFRCNERDRAVLYEPFSRISRKGKRVAENERLFVRAFKEHGISMKVLASVLQREVRELGIDRTDLAGLGDMRKLGTGVDLVLAYRYLYYVHATSIMSDQAYDMLEKEEIEFGDGGKILETVGSDRAEDYPPHIRALGMYLAFKYAKRKGP